MKSNKVILTSVLTFFLLIFTTSDASAKVMWGKTELKEGQIGKITVIKPINLWERDASNNLKFIRVLNLGEEYRVYRYDDHNGGQYGLGGGMWITNMPTHIKYETPSKAKLAELENGSFSNTRIQQFFNEFSATYEEGDFGKNYDMWEGFVWYYEGLEQYYENKDSYINHMKQKPKYKVSMKLVEIADIGRDRDGSNYATCLVQINVKEFKNGKIVDVDEGLAYFNVMRLDNYPSPYGFILDDSVEFLDEINDNSVLYDLFLDY